MSIYARDDSAPIVEDFREYDPPLEEHLTYTAVGDEKLPAGFITLKQHAEDRKAHRERADKPVTKTEIDNLNPNAQKEHSMAPATTVHPSATDNQIFNFENQNTEHYSPFDQIKQTHEDGSEFWSARDLMEIMGYTGANPWRHFRSNVMGRSRKALNNVSAGETNVSRSAHIEETTKMVKVGFGEREVDDFILTRYGAYLVAMNGDPNKPEVAAAQAYFAINTHENEVRKQQDQFQLPANYVEALEALVVAEKDKLELETNLKAESEAHQATQQLSEERLRKGKAYKAKAQPKVDAFDAWISGQGVYLLGNAAKIIDQGRNGIGQNRLFKFLREEGVLCKGGSRHNVPKQNFAKYFRVKTTTWQTSDGMDRVSMTTYVTPEGLTWIAKRLRSAGFEI